MKRVLFIAISFIYSCVIYAHDFEVDGIYYNIVSEIDGTVEVSFRGDFYNSFEDEYIGHIVIPSSVIINNKTYSIISIGAEAFARCVDLLDVEIPNTVLSIKNEAFSGCKGLTSIELPSNVETIGNSAFQDCTGLTTVCIPNSVNSIGDFVFVPVRD